ncbi:hypothetical protein K437DRAFT_99902 [Tilletiaria anomala UBC 951]|uniref:Uncharacterized protein n=1 Tax=Tilletiaria anomala (strain ATCC 24038 / CBS 436.72 / UBC 951) TaxID=1037660 RepID=A0A066W087_TILAU|nr:uncharacterized protein K437DRAFT_99902 [Tilletiaria anomala UBC 951]KDN47347.1 hypothetical protein K437DRAFT_99902 [Tilletiaria anomala UBC 951]
MAATIAAAAQPAAPSASALAPREHRVLTPEEFRAPGRSKRISRYSMNRSQEALRCLTNQHGQDGIDGSSGYIGSVERLALSSTSLESLSLHRTPSSTPPSPGIQSPYSPYTTDRCSPLVGTSPRRLSANHLPLPPQQQPLARASSSPPSSFPHHMVEHWNSYVPSLRKASIASISSANSASFGSADEMHQPLLPNRPSHANLDTVVSGVGPDPLPSNIPVQPQSQQQQQQQQQQQSQTQQPRDTLPSNIALLTAYERSEQVRRNQKLTRLLGEESAGTIASIVPYMRPQQAKAAALAQRSFRRRRGSVDAADPASLLSSVSATTTCTTARSSKDNNNSRYMQHSGWGSGAGLVASSPAARKRSASFSCVSPNLSPQGTSHQAIDGIYPLSPTARPIISLVYLQPHSDPVNVQPKAAAVLGLEPGSNRPSPAACAAVTTIAATQTQNSASTIPKSLQKLHLRSQASGPKRVASHTYPSSAGFGTGVGNNSGGPLSALDALGARTNTLSREERKKKIAKLSRWLGAVVPPEMIVSGHLVQDATTPTAESATSSPFSASTAGLLKALRRDGYGSGVAAAAVDEGNSRQLQFTNTADLKSPSSLPEAEQGFASSFSARERFASVKKASKLEKMFGEKVPLALMIASQRAHERPVANSSVPRGVSHRDSRGDGIISFISPDDAVSKFDTVCTSSSQQSNSSGSAYRHSISSLAFLLDTDRDLLSEIICSLEEDEGGDNGGPVSFRSLSVESLDRITSAWKRPSSAGLLQRSAVETTSIRLPLATSPATPSTVEAPTAHSCQPEAQASYLDSDLESMIGSLITQESVDDADGQHELRRHRARKAQRLSKFFGEAVPLDISEITVGVGPSKLALQIGSGQIAAASGIVTNTGSSDSGGNSTSLRSRKDPSVQRTRTSFLSLMDSFEVEVAEDPHLSEKERSEIERRAEMVRARGAQAFTTTT